jgi:hypothetical protein
MSSSEVHKLSVIEDVETGNRFVVYTTASGTQLEPRFDGVEPWFTQKDLAAMYGVGIPTVNEHIKRFLDDGELDEAVIRDFRITASDGKSYAVKHYGLDVAFYVGYRVNSTEGKLFRRWATQMLVQEEAVMSTLCSCADRHPSASSTSGRQQDQGKCQRGVAY